MVIKIKKYTMSAIPILHLFQMFSDPPPRCLQQTNLDILNIFCQKKKKKVKTGKVIFELPRPQNLDFSLKKKYQVFQF